MTEWVARKAAETAKRFNTSLAFLAAWRETSLRLELSALAVDVIARQAAQAPSHG
jgi:hypothetical protein